VNGDAERTKSGRLIVLNRPTSQFLQRRAKDVIPFIPTYKKRCDHSIAKNESLSKTLFHTGTLSATPTGPKIPKGLEYRLQTACLAEKSATYPSACPIRRVLALSTRRADEPNKESHAK
jgi:hypothetical protein